MQNNKNLLILVNPKGGNYSDKKLNKFITILTQKKYSFFCYYSQTREDILNVLPFLLNNYSAILVMGGDGFLNEVINVLIEKGKDIPILPIPMGTSNLIASFCKINKNVNKWLSILERGKIFKIHPFFINNRRYFLLNLSIGNDANIVYKVEKKKSFFSKKLKYIFYFIKFLFKKHRFQVKLKVNKKSYKIENVKNIIGLLLPYYGLNVRIEKEKDFILYFFYKRNFIKYLLDIKNFFSGNYKWKLSLADNSGEIFIETIPSQKVQIDGEFFGYTPIKLKKSSKTIRLIVN